MKNISRAELDAYYARLYGLARDELRYILDPKEVHGEDFPGETFRVLREKEVPARLLYSSASFFWDFRRKFRQTILLSPPGWPWFIF